MASSQSFLQTPFGAAREIPISLFLEKILPPLHDSVDLETVTKAAPKRRKHTFNPPVNKNGRLWGYNKQKPSEIKGHNGYRSLQISAGRLSKALEDLSPSFEFRNNDAGLWDLEDRKEDTLPDAYLLVKPLADGSVDWASIAVSGVYRKLSSKGDAEVNIVKITRCMAQCIHQDPRRRYTYGFSAEDDNMRLWYCDKAQIVASEAFDFTQDVRTLIRFLLSVMFAEHHALGFDPTMTRRQEDNGPVQYEIVVRSESGEEHVYRTLELLSAPHTDRLVGRGTHVWKAVKIVDGHGTGEPVALKDSWVDHHREREGTTYHRICASASSASETRVIKSTFLTVIIHGDTFVAGAVDRTRLLPEGTSLSSAPPSGDPQSPDSYQIHYRVVYKEVCKPLRDITSLAVIFRTLREVVFGLAALYWGGWVHGDISIGNILLFDNHAKIADLEYTVQMSERQRHDCIGTPYFIPNEVKHRSYLFQPEPQKPSASSDPRSPVIHPDLLANNNDSVKPISKTSAVSEPDKDPVFLYNPIHDLESLWWLAVYFIVCMEVVDGDSKDETPEQAARRKNVQRKMATELFWNADSRLINFTHPTCFREHAQQLHPAVRNIALQLDSVRLKMVMTYRKAEVDVYNVQDKVAGDMHVVFSRSLGTIVANLNKGDVAVRPFLSE